MRAACYYGAAARVAPAPRVHDLRVAADLAERAATDLLRQSLQAARAEGAAEARATVAADLAQWATDKRDAGACYAAAALFGAAVDVTPDGPFVGAWGAESRQCEKAARSATQTALERARAEALPEAQAARAEAMRGAHAEGRRAGMEEARGAMAEALATARAALAAYPDSDLDRQEGARAVSRAAKDLRESLESLVAAAAYFRVYPVQNLPGDATPAAKEEGAAQ